MTIRSAVFSHSVGPEELLNWLAPWFPDRGWHGVTSRTDTPTGRIVMAGRACPDGGG